MVSYRQVFTSPEQAARNRFETDPPARLIALSVDTDSRFSTKRPRCSGLETMRG